jgi:RNA polymerase sigma-70 factor, ECF subfamily
MVIPVHNFPPSPSEHRDDHEVFMHYFARVHERLLIYIFSLVPNLADAEDIFQQVSLVLWRKFNEFQPGTDFLAWAAKIAYFKVQNFRRVASRDKLVFFDEQLMENLATEELADIALETERQSFLSECLKKLNRPHRELIEQVYGGKQTIQGLAAQLGRSPKTLYNRLNHIRRLLYECI